MIDIGVPVSGAIDDPQFDYGTVIGKAIGNLLGSIVTALPALGALFGAADKKLDTIDFEPGSATSRHPSGKARNRRPGAQGTPGTDASPCRPFTPPSPTRWRSVADGTQRRDAAHGHRACCRRRPWPVDAANPRARQAIEQGFSARYALRCSPRSRAAPWPNLLPPRLPPQPAAGRKRLLL